MSSDSSKKTAPVGGALFEVGSTVQISFKYRNERYRGQLGIVNEVTKKGGTGKDKNKWLY